MVNDKEQEEDTHNKLLLELWVNNYYYNEIMDNSKNNEIKENNSKDNEIKEDKSSKELLISSMMQVYQNEDQRNREIDSKSISMIEILLLILTIQMTFLSTQVLFPLIDIIHKSKTPLMYTLGTILVLSFFAIIILIIISTIFFIKSYKFHNFESTPNPDKLQKYHDNNWSYSTIIKILMGSFRKRINSNKKILDDKVKCSKYGFYFIYPIFVVMVIFVITSLSIYLIGG